MYTRWRARREPRVELTWETGDDPPCEWVIGADRPSASPYEMTHNALAPTLVYPLFETALRAEDGAGIDAHQHAVSELWSTFAGVAAANPDAWSPARPSARLQIPALPPVIPARQGRCSLPLSLSSEPWLKFNASRTGQQRPVRFFCVNLPFGSPARTSANLKANLTVFSAHAYSLGARFFEP
jgi:hypothetical protein